MPWFEIQHQASQSDPLKDVKPNPTVLTRMHRLVIDCLSGPNSRALEPWFLRKRRAAPSVLQTHSLLSPKITLFAHVMKRATK